jgi:hypothetical protein
MSRFREELKVIPRTTYFIAAVIYLILATVLFEFAVMRQPDFQTWPLIGKVLFAYGIFLILYVYMLLIGYVYGDAKRRGMRYVMWTFLAALVPQAIGIILYFILRDPLPQPCPGCNARVLGSFAFCPHCGAAMKPSCPQCGKSVQHAWSNCAFCGAKLPSTAQSAA